MILVQIKNEEGGFDSIQLTEEKAIEKIQEYMDAYAPNKAIVKKFDHNDKKYGMTLNQLKKYLPEGKKHPCGKLSDNTLARYVDMLFLKDDTDIGNTEKEKADDYWTRKEVAFQVIQRLLSVYGVIQTEDDWEQYFEMKDQESC